jgi:prolyl-tRNA synthetase
MKDLYTFDADLGGARATYDAVSRAYEEVFRKLALPVAKVRADSGNIGGLSSEEFHVVTEAGEDTLLACSQCGKVSNVEATEFVDDDPAGAARALAEWSRFLAAGGNEADLEASETLQVQWAETVDFKTRAKSLVAIIGRKGRDPNLTKVRRVVGGDEINPLPKKPDSLASAAARIVHHTLAPAEQGGAPAGSATTKDDRGLAYRYADALTARAGDKCACCQKGTLEEKRGIEVGHVFLLGSKYSETLKATVLPPGTNFLYFAFF